MTVKDRIQLELKPDAILMQPIKNENADFYVIRFGKYSVFITYDHNALIDDELDEALCTVYNKDEDELNYGGSLDSVLSMIKDSINKL